MTIFTLEALQAAHGDALLLHYGSESDPRLIIVDGGPKGVYKSSLSPRLKAIRAARGGGKLEVRLLMVSHIDDDHITGVLDLTKELCGLQENGDELPYDILALWHNSFDDLIAKAGSDAQVPLRARSISTRGGRTNGDAIAASVPQGRQLRADANTLSLNVNSGFDELVQFDSNAAPMNMGQGLTFTVLGPRKAELDALQAKWAREVKALLKKKKEKKKSSRASPTAADLEAVAAAFIDDSIHNLSSIVVFADCAGKSILLTGDARGDFIIDSLREAGLLKNGKMHVDILKAPHHGSIRNVEDVFFEAVVADHYVFSANGRDDNPDVETFKVLFKVRKKGPYTLWFTNEVTAPLAFIKAKKPDGVKVKVRNDSDPSVLVELGTPIGG